MGTVALEGIEFFAYHGVSDEEQKIGNRYTIDVNITTDFTEAARFDRLEGTVNYAIVYEIVAKQMQKSTRLLEHIAHQIIEECRKVYPDIETIEVSVSKHNPPIGGVCARSKITLKG